MADGGQFLSLLLEAFLTSNSSYIDREKHHVKDVGGLGPLIQH